MARDRYRAGRHVLRARLLASGASEAEADRQVGPVERTDEDTERLHQSARVGTGAIRDPNPAPREIRLRTVFGSVSRCIRDRLGFPEAVLHICCEGFVD